MQGVILVSVFKFFTDASAYFHSILRRDSQIASIEQGVEVLAKQDSISSGMHTSTRDGLYMSCFQNVKDRGLGKSATAELGARGRPRARGNGHQRAQD